VHGVPDQIDLLETSNSTDDLPRALVVWTSRNSLTTLDEKNILEGVRFARDEIRTLSHHPVHLQTLGDYSSSDEFQRWVEPLARLRGGGIKGTLEHLRDWTVDRSSSVCLLLGEFGAGKTMTARVLAARYAEMALTERTCPVILVDLRAWSGPVELAGLVRRTLDIENIAPYRFAVEEGECLLILDGFDEMSNRLTPGDLAEALRALLAWRTDRSIILITCRTHLFIDSTDLDRVFAEATGALFKTPGLGEIDGATVLALQLFDKERIQAYLAQVTSEPDRAWEAMAKVHDLRNLAERPMLLDLIRQTLPELTRSEKVALGDLYEMYVQKWAEWPGPDEWLDPLQKIDFAEELAFAIWNDGPEVEDGAVRVEQLAGILLRGKPIDWIHRFDNDAVRLELRAGTFLVWKDGGERGYYHFAHRSFLEYMLARRTVRDLAEANREALDLPRFSPEVIGYCKARPGWEAARREAAAILVEPYRKRVSENALLLVGSEEGIASSAEKPWLLEGAELQQVSMGAAQLAGARLEKAVLTGAVLMGANLPGARLDGAVLDGADLSQANFSDATLKGATAWGAVLDGTRFERADLRGAGLEGSSAFAEAPVLRGARLEGVDLTGAAWREPAPGIELCALINMEETRWRSGGDVGLAGGDQEGSRVETAWHRGGVYGVAFSPDGTRLATACDDRVVRIWEARTGRLLQTLQGHSGVVTSVAWTADGERLAAGSSDETARVWEATTGRLMHTLQGHMRGVTSVAWTADGERLVTGSDDTTARVWEAMTGRLLHTLHGHTEEVTSVAWMADGERLATGSEDATARVWEATTGWLLHTLQGHTQAVTSVAWTADGERLATGSDDKTARVWEATTGRLLHTLRGHTQAVSSVAWTADGERLATGSDDTTARVWEATTGRLLHTFQGHTQWVTSVAWTADGERLATGSHDSTARVWSASNAQELATFLHTPSGGVAICGIHVVLSGAVDLSDLVLRTGTQCAPLALYADLCLRPDLVAEALAGNPPPSLHVPMDTAVRSIAAAAHEALVPSDLGALPPIKAGSATTLPTPWAIPADLANLHGFRLTLKALLPEAPIELPVDPLHTTLDLPALPPGTHQLLLTLHLGDRHERSFTFPLTVLAQNPYIAGPPVRGADLHGREADLARIRARLKNGSIRLVGERRIGKTSILHHFLDAPGPGFVPLWLDAQTLDDVASFRDWILSALRARFADAPAAQSDLLAFLRARAARGQTPLLLIDEVVHLRGLSVSDAGLLRSLCAPPFASILAGSPSDWSQFFASLPNDAGSPFNTLQDVFLGPLTEAQMRALVIQPGVAAPEDATMLQILEMCGGRPYLAQRLCEAALDRTYAEGRMRMEIADVEAVARETLVTGLAHQHEKRWGELTGTPAAQTALVAYVLESVPAPRALHDTLREHGLFDGLVWTVDPAFMMWIREREAT
jgi:uncharacterized protein YjiK